MGENTPALGKELREKTGAGMMDCKAALAETGGDVEGAVDWLRKKGLSAAAKKAGRVAAEGLIGIATEGRIGADIEALKAMRMPGAGNTVADHLTELVAKIGENMNLRRARRLEVANGVIVSY